MKELSIERMEMVSGGCGFTEMMFYATAQQYHMGQLGTESPYLYYHSTGVVFYTARMMACM
jgi:hypothetical protein